MDRQDLIRVDEKEEDGHIKKLRLGYERKKS